METHGWNRSAAQRAAEAVATRATAEMKKRVETRVAQQRAAREMDWAEWATQAAEKKAQAEAEQARQQAEAERQARLEKAEADGLITEELGQLLTRIGGGYNPLATDLGSLLAVRKRGTSAILAIKARFSLDDGSDRPRAQIARRAKPGLIKALNMALDARAWVEQAASVTILREVTEPVSLLALLDFCTGLVQEIEAAEKAANRAEDLARVAWQEGQRDEENLAKRQAWQEKQREERQTAQRTEFENRPAAANPVLRPELVSYKEIQLRPGQKKTRVVCIDGEPLADVRTRTRRGKKIRGR